MDHLVVATTEIAISNPTRGAAVELELTRIYQGTPAIANPRCRFRYSLDFCKSDGSACLNTINDEPVNITLYPLGKEGMWDFISEIQTTRFMVGKQSFILYRVALNIDPFTGEESAAILLNQNGSCVLGTENFDTYCSALTA